MKITTSVGIAATVLALTIACASAQTKPSEVQLTPAASTATAPAAGGVPRSVLERYVGEYQLTPQATAVVRLSGATLVRQMMGPGGQRMGQEVAFTPISETRFKLGGGEVEFETDQAGKVTMVVGDRRYPRKAKS